MGKKRKSASQRAVQKVGEEPRESHYSYLRIVGFRGFTDLELHGLSKINLFLGRNNCGKTSILEAIYAHACGHNFAPFLGQVILRRQDSSALGHLALGEKLQSLFQNRSTTPYSFALTAKLSGSDRNTTTKATFEPSSAVAGLDPVAFGQQYDAPNLGTSLLPTDAADGAGRQIGLRPRSEPSTISLGRWITETEGARTHVDVQFPPTSFPAKQAFKLAVMHDVLAHRVPDAEIKVFSHLKRRGVLAEFIANLSRDFPEVEDIDVIPYPDGSLGPVYAITQDERRLPLWAFGDGLRRWYHLLGHMLVYQNACHCIEEVDATLHWGIQSSFSALLVEYALRSNNQIFLTSHSIEFADALLEALYGAGGTVGSEDDDPVRVFTLRMEEGSTTPSVRALSGRDAYAKRNEFSLELR